MNIKDLMGTWIYCNARVEKKTELIEDREDQSVKITTHPPVPKHRRTQEVVMVTGQRYLMCGEIDMEYAYNDPGYEGWASTGTFRCTGTKRVLCAVKDHRTNPFFVDIDTATTLDGRALRELLF